MHSFAESSHITHQSLVGIHINKGRLERYSKECLTHFQISQNPQLLKSAYALRYDVFDKEMKVGKGNARTGQECDVYDRYSLHAFLHINHQLATYARMVTDGYGRFPHEEIVSIPPKYFERETSIELSRATSVKKWRRSEAVWLCFEEILEYCSQQGIKTALGLSTAAMFNGLKKHNVAFRYVSAPIIAYTHYKAYAYVIDIEETLSKS